MNAVVVDQPELLTREFAIVLSKKGALVAELERLARRAKRIGAPAIAWTFGEVEQKKVTVGEGLERLVPFVHLTLTGCRPQIAGWEFVATVQHLDGANILRACPRPEELTVPEIYRTRESVCDHCQLARGRRDTYLLLDAAGTWKQVGSSCLVDFLGHEDPHAIAAYAEMLASALALCEGAEEDGEGGYGFGGGGPRVFALLEFLACAAAEVRESGWTPKSAVPERPGASTAAMAEDRIAPHKEAPKRDRSLLDVDRAVAEATLEWALGLETSGERLNDYLWNLYAVAKSGIAERRTFGIAASMVAAYTKAEVRKRERAARKPSEHVGEVGESRSFILTLDRHFSFETAWGWVDRFLFRDADDNVFTWKASGDSSVIGLKAPDNKMVEGERYILSASIKKHDDYKGTKQTVLTRAAVRPFDAAVFGAIRDEEVRKVLGKKVKAGTASAEETAEFKRLDAARKAAMKKAAAEVAAFMTFDTTLFTSHFPSTHEAVDAGHGIWIDYVASQRYGAWVDGGRPIIDDSSVRVHVDGQWAADYKGKDALDRARKFVAERLAKCAVK